MLHQSPPLNIRTSPRRPLFSRSVTTVIAVSLFIGAAIIWSVSASSSSTSSSLIVSDDTRADSTNSIKPLVRRTTAAEEGMNTNKGKVVTVDGVARLPSSTQPYINLNTRGEETHVQSSSSATVVTAESTTKLQTTVVVEPEFTTSTFTSTTSTTIHTTPPSTTTLGPVATTTAGSELNGGREGGASHHEDEKPSTSPSSPAKQSEEKTPKKITVEPPTVAFKKLLRRVFGHKRVLYQDPINDTPEKIIDSITFVPTRWVQHTDGLDKGESRHEEVNSISTTTTTDSQSDLQTQSSTIVYDEYEHALNLRVWRGPPPSQSSASSATSHPSLKKSPVSNEAANFSASTRIFYTTASSSKSKEEDEGFKSNQRLVIYAETPSEAGYALHHYLRHVLSSSVEWGVDGTGYNIVIPPGGLPKDPHRRQGGTSRAEAEAKSAGNKESDGERVSAVDGADVYITSVGQYRYYYNVCTFGYTSAFWTWEDRWEQEIDWMALHGTNLVLMSLPTEYLWILTYTEPQFGLKESDATSYFTGPAFLPWNRMGNIHSYAGPASVAFFKQQFDLALRVVQRMRDLGIRPILPAFSGHVGDAFVAKFKPQNPEAFARGADWGGMDNSNSSRNWILLPSTALFKELGIAYMRNVVSHFGLSTYYAGDTWNEMAPPSGDREYLKNSASAVLECIRAVDPNGVWILQGWTFYNDKHWWSVDKVRDYLSGAPHGQLIVLDLTSDNNPVYPWTDGYFGHNFIWNMLHNYGGKRGIWGAMGVVASVPSTVFHSGKYPSMVGVGTTPEGTETNPALYALLFDSAWGTVSSEKQLREEWLPLFWRSRLGDAVSSYAPDAVATLGLPMLQYRGAYTFIPPCCSHWNSFEQRPWLITAPFSSNSHTVNTDYNPDSITEALINLLQPLRKMGKKGWIALAKSKNPSLVTYRYELVDYLRQVIGCLFTDAHFGGLVPHLRTRFSFSRRGRAKMTAGGTSSSSSSTTLPPPPSTLSSSSSASEADSSQHARNDIDDAIGHWEASFKDMMRDVEALVGTDDNFLLGRWLKSAIDASPTHEEARLFVFNAVRQLTLWGPKESPAIHDYASKQWDGLIRTFYIPRWSLFFSYIRDIISANGGVFNMPASADDWVKQSIDIFESPIAEQLQFAVVDESNTSVIVINNTNLTAALAHRKVLEGSDDRQRREGHSHRFSLLPTSSLEDAYSIIVSLADKYVPSWREYGGTSPSASADGGGGGVVSSEHVTPRGLNQSEGQSGRRRWEDDFEVVYNVTVTSRPLYRTWAGMPQSQLTLCRVIPDCTGFSSSADRSPFGGSLFGFERPLYKPAAEGEARENLFLKKQSTARDLRNE